MAVSLSTFGARTMRLLPPALAHLPTGNDPISGVMGHVILVADRTLSGLAALQLTLRSCTLLEEAPPTVVDEPVFLAGLRVLRGRPPSEWAEPRVGVRVDDVQAFGVSRLEIPAHARLPHGVPVGHVPQQRRL